MARSDPHLGPVYLSKIDIADGFYHIAIHPDDIPKMSMMFPIQDGEEQLIDLHLVIPMGGNSPCLYNQQPPKRSQT
jgi:hypothetical protein